MKFEVARIVDQFRRSHDGDPWHGSSLMAILESVTAKQAAQPPPSGAHSIWEMVLHVTAWRNETARRASGAPAGEPQEGDYPPIGDPTPERWAEALAALDVSHVRLVAAVVDMGDAQLWTPTNDSRNRPLGTGVTYYELFHGVVQHDAYHAGQIAILKRILG